MGLEEYVLDKDIERLEDILHSRGFHKSEQGPTPITWEYKLDEAIKYIGSNLSKKSYTPDTYQRMEKILQDLDKNVEKGYLSRALKGKREFKNYQSSRVPDLKNKVDRFRSTLNDYLTNYSNNFKIPEYIPNASERVTSDVDMFNLPRMAGGSDQATAAIPYFQPIDFGISQKLKKWWDVGARVAREVSLHVGFVAWYAKQEFQYEIVKPIQNMYRVLRDGRSYGLKVELDRDLWIPMKNCWNGLFSDPYKNVITDVPNLYTQNQIDRHSMEDVAWIPEIKKVS